MVRKAAPGLRPTSPDRANSRGSDDGFTLLEVICVVAIVAMLAAILLPAAPRATTRPQLESYAVEIASLLNADHNAAVRRRIDVATAVDARHRTLKSAATGQVLRIPDDVSVTLVSAMSCQHRRSDAAIMFLASGMSCGGAIILARAGFGYEIRINWLTGGTEIVPHDAI